MLNLQAVLKTIFYIFLLYASMDHFVLAAPLPIAQDKKPLVLLISIDGFKHEYLNRGLTPTLSRLARKGVAARGLISSFPSVTFPNHYSLVTGLVPDHHGIVNNTMYDPEIPNQVFKLSSREALKNPKWWNDGMPIWVTAEQQAKITSTLFWPGSETPIHGIQPHDWLTYDDHMSSMQRVTHLLGWLNRAENERADFATLYFSEVDHSGHGYGPNSVVTNDSIHAVDSAIQALLEGLDQLNLTSKTSIIIVTDHGMAEVGSNNVINLKALLKDYDKADIKWTGAFGGIEINQSDLDNALTALKKQKHMDCWKKEQIPQRLNFGKNRRIPAIFCLAEEGWFIGDKDFAETPVLGMHGYDSNLKDMQGIFIASGYRIKQQDEQLEPFANVDVYPLLLRLIGLEGGFNDGNGHLLNLIDNPDVIVR